VRSNLIIQKPIKEFYRDNEQAILHHCSQFQCAEQMDGANSFLVK